MLFRRRLRRFSAPMQRMPNRELDRGTRLGGGLGRVLLTSPDTNPNGIGSTSPWLPAPGYYGNPSIITFNPERVESRRRCTTTSANQSQTYRSSKAIS
jgi:hypothetical protein